MKLAEALIIRADVQKRIAQLKQRLLRNVKVQEGYNPSENPAELIEQFMILTKELEIIIRKINVTNSYTAVGDYDTLADKLAERDVLKLKYDMFSSLIETASIREDRYSKSEIKFRSAINIPGNQKVLDDIAKNLRTLDSSIQELNWSTELFER